MRNFIAVISFMWLTGCAAFPSCTIGIALFVAAPVPYLTCDFTVSPEEIEEVDEDA